MMFGPDEDDDFIVDIVGEDAPTPGSEQGSAAFSWADLKRLVFAKRRSAGAREAVAPAPSLPPGFSAMLNAEEEEMYPARVRRGCGHGMGYF